MNYKTEQCNYETALEKIRNNWLANRMTERKNWNNQTLR